MVQDCASGDAYGNGRRVVSGETEVISGMVHAPRFPFHDSIPYVVQRLSQLVPSAVDVRLYGAEWKIEKGGDLFIRSTLNVPEHDTVSIFGAQLRDGPFNG